MHLNVSPVTQTKTSSSMENKKNLNLVALRTRKRSGFEIDWVKRENCLHLVQDVSGKLTLLENCLLCLIRVKHRQWSQL